MYVCAYRLHVYKYITYKSEKLFHPTSHSSINNNQLSNSEALKDLEVAASSAIPESDRAKSRPPPLKCKGETRTPGGRVSNGRVERGGKPRGLGGKLKNIVGKYENNVVQKLKEKGFPLEVQEVFEL